MKKTHSFKNRLTHSMRKGLILSALIVSSLLQAPQIQAQTIREHPYGAGTFNNVIVNNNGVGAKATVEVYAIGGGGGGQGGYRWGTVIVECGTGGAGGGGAAAYMKFDVTGPLTFSQIVVGAGGAGGAYGAGSGATRPSVGSGVGGGNTIVKWSENTLTVAGGGGGYGVYTGDGGAWGGAASSRPSVITPANWATNGGGRGGPGGIGGGKPSKGGDCGIVRIGALNPFGGGEGGNIWNNSGCSGASTSPAGEGAGGNGGHSEGAIGYGGKGGDGKVIVRVIPHMSTVTFNSQGGSAVAPQNIQTGTVFTPPANPTKAGFTFGGWWRSATGGNQWDFEKDAVTSNITLYARWNVTVTFIEGFRSDGTTEIVYKTQAVQENTRITEPEKPTRKNYLFTGWSTVATGGNSWNFNNTINVNTKLYAQWTEMPRLTTNPASTTAIFDMWEKKVTLSWQFVNNNGRDAHFYVYRRLNRSTYGDNPWKSLTPNGLLVKNENSANWRLHTFVDTDSELAYNTTYEYRIHFIETGQTAEIPSTTPDYNNLSYNHAGTSVGINTTVDYSKHSSIETKGQNNGIMVTYQTNSNLRNGTIANIDENAVLEHRRAAVGSIPATAWAQIYTWSLKGDQEYPYLDASMNDACYSYEYRVVFRAFERRQEINGGPENIKGTASFAATDGLRASKGEYANRIRLQWNMDIPAGSNIVRTYRVSRRMVTNENLNAPDPEFKPMATVTDNGREVIWNDDNVLTGVFYQYKVALIQTCDGLGESEVAREFDIGFTQAFGRVLGRITYGSGTSVEGVNVRAITREDKSQFQSLRFDGGNRFEWKPKPAYFNEIWNKKQWTLQFWVNPDDTYNPPNAGSSAEARMASIGGRNIHLQRSSAGDLFRITFPTQYNATDNMHSETIIPRNRFTHVTIKRNGAEFSVHIVNDSDPGNIHIVTNTFTAPAAHDPANDNERLISFGHNFSGHIDDVRFWDRVLSEDEILRDYSRILAGNEAGLKAYWTFDNDALQGYAFDRSRMGTEFNNNHATKNDAVFSTIVPEDYQLSLKGITNSNGNYEIAGIPFMGEGTSYSIIPKMPMHTFNPEQHLRYISGSSVIHNGTDFTDISSFSVNGRVTFENSDYGVEGALIRVDGLPANRDGQPIMSDIDGLFTVDVPIGEHFISIEKNGHTFANGGRFPADLGNVGLRYNFQTNITTPIEFKDQTKVRLMGRVAGGQQETDKQLGFGLSKANIGKAKITLESQGGSLNSTGSDFKTEGTIGGKNTAATFIKDSRFIEIETDSETGEFVAVLPPVPYSLWGVETEDFKDINFARSDFSYSKTSFDMSPLRSDTTSYFDSGNNRTLTFGYNDSVKITRYNEPTIVVADIDAVPGALGDSIYVYTNSVGDNITLRMYTVENGIAQYALGVSQSAPRGIPVLSQATGIYNWQVKAYEDYVNRDKPAEPVTERVPLAGKEIAINNALAAKRLYFDPSTKDETGRCETETSLFLNEEGVGDYSFRVSFPNMGGDHRLGVKISLDQNGTEFAWEQSAILFGQMPTDGNNFVTKGPDHVDIVLHDPPGSNSYAYIEEGSSYSYQKERRKVSTFTESFDFTFHLGLKTDWGTGGFGFMLMTEVDNKADVILGYEIKHVWTRNNTHQKSVTFNKKISTSSEPDKVGSMADVYIGQSTNLVFGKMNQLALYPDAERPGGVTPVYQLDNFSLFNKEVLAGSEDFTTAFQYTQAYLIETQIPNIKKLRNDLIEYVAVMPTDRSQIEFGSDTVKYFTSIPKSDSIFREANLKKNSVYYVFYKKDDQVKTDEVSDYCDWIINWEERIAENEKRKVDMFKNRAEYEKESKADMEAYFNDRRFFENISFDAGVAIAKSLEAKVKDVEVYSNIYTNKWTVGEKFGLKFGGFGITQEIKFVPEHEFGDQVTQEWENTLKFGYELKDTGNDALSIDVYGPVSKASVDELKKLKLDTIPFLSGFMFRTRAGQTSCPHEPADSTLYYKDKDGKPFQLNYGTFRIEKPVIYINGTYKEATAANIPAGREAVFNIELQNQSEANIDVTYMLSVVPESNPHGLVISMDGAPLVAGRPIRINYGNGQEVKKTLRVSQSSLDMLDYNNIRVRLSSVCDANLFDEVLLNAKFTPSSSPVTLSANRTLANIPSLDRDTESGEITFTISEYDRQFKGFELIRLQYRSAAPGQEQLWRDYKSFLINAGGFYKEEDTDGKIDGHQFTCVYTYGKNDTILKLSDDKYYFRALAVSRTGNADVTSPGNEILIVKDLAAPRVLGNPSPVNGILNIGDEISVTYNEDVQTGDYTKFTISGILNAEPMQTPTSGLLFDGNTGRAYTELPIHAGNSFSIEAYIQMQEHKAGTLFAYGEGGNYFSLGFDNAGRPIVAINGEQRTATVSLAASIGWKYISVSYDGDKKAVTFHADYQTLIHWENTPTPPAQGKLHVGNNAAGTNGFKGAVSMLQFYNTVRDAFSTTYKSGNEPNLIGLWELKEGEGTVAKDKARNRNLVLNTSWYVYPQGKSLALNGTGDYATFPSSDFIFLSSDDFTWEFWFKGAAQAGAATLLSAGMSAYVGFNAGGELTLTTGANTQVLAPAGLLNDQWHHFALSARRNGTIRALVDGKVTASFSSNNISEKIGGNNYYLGVRYELGAVPQLSEYFKGNIDEVRVWNAALTTDVILLEKNCKLYGTEAGLKAYFPFESWQKVDGQSAITVLGSLDNMVPGSSGGIEGVAVGSLSNIAAPMQDARPVSDVPFTITASERKFVLNINEDQAPRIEGVTLKITAENVLDMHNNLSGAHSWIAYVNRNALKWDSDPIAMIVERDADTKFKATIINHSGENAAYYIENVPSWLTVDAPSGNLRPLTNKELTFSVSKAINIGNYETAIVLRGDNNAHEILPVTLKVIGKRPDWSVNPEDFELWMSVTGQVRIEGIPQEDEDDLLAAFVGEKCIGIASPKYETSYQSYFVYMSIWGGDSEDQKKITFKFWDASTGLVYPVMELSKNNSPFDMKFIGNDSHGTPDSPVLFNALNIIEQSITLGSGWNWISFNVDPPLIDQFKANTSNYGVQLKNSDGVYINNPDGIWSGPAISLDVKQSYLLKTTRAASLKMMGNPVQPAATPITLAANKWSWIGYTPQFTLTVAEALAGISDPKQGDQIKGQTGYRIMSSNGWIGSLNAMEPGRGYMYKSENNQPVTFNYPSVSSMFRSSQAVQQANAFEMHWKTDHFRFAASMTVTASLFFGDEEIDNGLFEIGAFCGDECRGNAIFQYVAGFEHPFMGFLMIYGEEKESITLKIYDHETGREYSAKERFNFSADATFGTPDKPYAVSVNSPTGIDHIHSKYILYPNPTEKLLFISHNGHLLEKLVVTDIMGRVMLMENNFTAEYIDVSSLSAGIYFLRIIEKDQTFVYRFMKK